MLITTITTHTEAKQFNFFIEESDGHTAFTILFRLDVSFVMAPHALRLRHPAAPDVPSILRPKPGNLPLPSFEVQTGKPAAAWFCGLNW